MALSWEDILSSSDYLQTVTQIQNALGRQFRAVPSAAPEVRNVAGQVGGRLAKLEDIGGQIDLSNRRLDLKAGELALERRELNRYARRLPIAAAVGVGNLALSGLGAYANLKAIGRSEARGRDLMSLQSARAAAEAQRLQSLEDLQRQTGALYQGFLTKFPEPEFP